MERNRKIFLSEPNVVPARRAHEVTLAAFTGAGDKADSIITEVPPNKDAFAVTSDLPPSLPVHGDELALVRSFLADEIASIFRIG